MSLLGVSGRSAVSTKMLSPCAKDILASKLKFARTIATCAVISPIVGAGSALLFHVLALYDMPIDFGHEAGIGAALGLAVLTPLLTGVEALRSRLSWQRVENEDRQVVTDAIVELEDNSFDVPSRVKNLQVEEVKVEDGGKIPSLDNCQFKDPAHKGMIVEALKIDPEQKYVQLAELEKGGMGVVTLVWNVEKGQYEVEKAVRNYKDLSEEKRDILRPRFLQEARAMRDATITDPESMTKRIHPNVVKIYDFEEDSEDGPLIRMEYIDGEHMRARLERVTKLPSKEAVTIISRILSVLKAIQEDDGLESIHRDITPENIMLVGEKSADDVDWVKLIDFGSVKINDPDHITTLHERLGKCDYMALEQTIPGGEPTAKTDIFTLGSLLYEMLSGELPFGSSDDDLVKRQIALKSKPKLERKEIPPALRDILGRMLEIEQENRPDHEQIRVVLALYEIDPEISGLLQGVEQLQANLSDSLEVSDREFASEFREDVGKIEREAEKIIREEMPAIRDETIRIFPPEPIVPVEAEVRVSDSLDNLKQREGAVAKAKEEMDRKLRDSIKSKTALRNKVNLVGLKIDGLRHQREKMEEKIQTFRQRRIVEIQVETDRVITPLLQALALIDSAFGTENHVVISSAKDDQLAAKTSIESIISRTQNDRETLIIKIEEEVPEECQEALLSLNQKIDAITAELNELKAKI
ncbi:MAG: protein kinase [Candidatus Saganbacteria bacterium]|nr:protein kinase [Candidatus Saganbacteria bacterium]